MRMNCEQFNAPLFLIQDEWKTLAEMEAVLRYSSTLTTIFQNEKKMNSSCGPVVRNVIHDGLSSVPLNVIDADAWSKSKIMTHPTRTATNTALFTITGKTCLNRALLEREKRF